MPDHDKDVEKLFAKVCVPLVQDKIMEESDKTREYYQRPDVKAKQREYNRDYFQRPDVKAKQREYMKEYMKEYNQRKKKEASDY